MSNQTKVTQDATPWGTMLQAIKDALTGKPHPGQSKTVSIGNDVTVSDPLGGSIHGGYKISVSNTTEQPPKKGH